MQQISRSACVPYSVSQMLELVNDIPAYPDFLHWCQDARIDSIDGDTVHAALEIGIRGIHRTMRTRNRTVVSAEDDSARITIDMVDGPLKRLSGEWTFEPAASGGCNVELRLGYEVHRTPFGFLLRTLFDEIAHSQLNAFIRRADSIYGTA